jgi:hypothetical protein
VYRDLFRGVVGDGLSFFGFSARVALRRADVKNITLQNTRRRNGVAVSSPRYSARREALQHPPNVSAVNKAPE